MIKIHTVNFLKFSFLFYSVLSSWVSVYSQDTKMSSEQKNYDKIIEKLVLKESPNALSVKEYFILSDAYVNTDNQYQSLLVLDKMITKIIAPNDIENLAIAYNRKVENLIDLSKIRDGVKFCDEILPVLEGNNEIIFQSFCVKCGILYDQDRQHDKAFDIYNQVNQSSIRQSPVFINNYGVVLMNLKKYDSAITYLKKGIHLSYDANQLDHINVSFTNIAKILIEKEEWVEAEKYLDSADASFDEKSIVVNRKEWLETYCYFYLRQNKLEKAEETLQKLKRYYNTIFDYKIDEKLKELDVINKRKTVLDKRITLLNNEIEDTRKTKLIGFIILGSLILIITTWSLIMIYRNTELNYREMIKKQEVLASQMTPHFIFNSLSILQGMVLNNEHQKASKYLSKFSFLLNPIIKDELQKFVPINDELILLENYVDLQNLSTAKDIVLSIDVQQIIKETILIPPMILQPFVENSIIHGFKESIKEPKIKIQFEFVKKSLRCIITDNGVGFLSGEKNEYENKTSLATKIVQDRFELLFAKTKRKPSIEIEDLRQNGTRGTRVLLELPYILKK